MRQYPLGTVDNIDSVWLSGNFCRGGSGNRQAACEESGGEWARRANPRVGYSATQQFTRDTWSLTHTGQWDFANSFVSLSYVDTQNHGRTLPFTTSERELLLTMIDASGDYAGLTEDERRDIAAATFLPRPKRVMASSQYTLDIKLDIPFAAAGQHVLVTGVQLIRGELEDSVFGMEQGTPGGVQDNNMWSVFAEDSWDLLPDFTLTAGLRHDDHQVFGNQLSPRLYGVYRLNSDWTLKGGISTGFKTPQTTQLYNGVVGFGGQGTLPLYGNPDLAAETSVSGELAVYWNHADGHNVNLTLFQNDFDDKIASQPCGATTNIACVSTGDYADLGYATSSKTVNIDKVTIQGAELAGRWLINDSLALRANYTYTDSEQKSGANKGQPLGNSAKHMANLTLNWQASEVLDVFLTSEYRTKRFRSWDTIADKALYYKGYNVFHLGASYQASESVTFNARINNLFDQDFTSYDLAFSECDDTSANCVVDANGVVHKVDAIICGTGFDVADPLGPLKIRGRDGLEVREKSQGMSAYLGTTLKDLPNLFMLLGPNTALGHNSIIFMIEQQIKYVIACLEEMDRRGAATIEVKPAAQDAYNDRIQAELQKMVWSEGGCKSWYIDENGRNFTIWPGFTWKYWMRMRSPDFRSFNFGKTA